MTEEFAPRKILVKGLLALLAGWLGNPGQTLAAETSTYDSCAGKGCGDRCTLCDPADQECTELLPVRYCDFNQECVPYFGGDLVCSPEEDVGSWSEWTNPPDFGDPVDMNLVLAFAEAVGTQHGIPADIPGVSLAGIAQGTQSAHGADGCSSVPGFWPGLFETACNYHDECYAHGWDYSWGIEACSEMFENMGWAACDQAFDPPSTPGECGDLCQCDRMSEVYRFAMIEYGSHTYHVDPEHNAFGGELECAPETVDGTHLEPGLYGQFYEDSLGSPSIPNWSQPAEPDTYCADRYDLGGTIRGLTPISGLPQELTIALTVERDGTDPPDTFGTATAMPDDQPFVFDPGLIEGDNYLVWIIFPPTNRNCWIDSGESGTMPAEPVNDVEVHCNGWYPVRAAVSGLESGESLEVALASSRWSDMKATLSTNETHHLLNLSGHPDQLLRNGDTYDLRIIRQPDERTCRVVEPTGLVDDQGAQVLDAGDVLLNIECEGYRVGGHVVGVTDGESVVIDNGRDPSPLTIADGPFEFETEYATGEAYSVSIVAEPSGQSCVLRNESGVIDDESVTDVLVDCGEQTLSPWVLLGRGQYTRQEGSGGSQHLQCNGDNSGVARSLSWDFQPDLPCGSSPSDFGQAEVFLARLDRPPVPPSGSIDLNRVHPDDYDVCDAVINLRGRHVDDMPRADALTEVVLEVEHRNRWWSLLSQENGDSYCHQQPTYRRNHRTHSTYTTRIAAGWIKIAPGSPEIDWLESKIVGDEEVLEAYKVQFNGWGEHKFGYSLNEMTNWSRFDYFFEPGPPNESIVCYVRRDNPQGPRTCLPVGATVGFGYEIHLRVTFQGSNQHVLELF